MEYRARVFPLRWAAPEAALVGAMSQQRFGRIIAGKCLRRLPSQLLDLGRRLKTIITFRDGVERVNYSESRLFCFCYNPTGSKWRGVRA